MDFRSAHVARFLVLTLGLVTLGSMSTGCSEPKKEESSLLPRTLRPQPKRLADLTKGESSDEELTKTGYRVAEAEGWLPDSSGLPFYEWVTWDAIYYFKHDGTDKKKWSIIELDTKTTKEKTIAPLTKVYTKEGNLGTGRLWPSTNRLLFMGQRPGNPVKYYIADEKGNEYRQWTFRQTPDRTRPVFSTVFWTPESHLVESVVDSTLSNRTKIQTWVTKAKDYEKAVPMPTVVLSVKPPQGTVPASRGGNKFFMIYSDKPREASEKVNIVFWEAASPTHEKVMTASFEGNYILDWKPFDDGQFVLWATTTCPTGPTSWIRSPENAAARPTEPQYIRLWITRSDGTGNRELGRIELKKGEEAADIQSFSGLRWVTNRLFVSFLFRGGMYEIYI